MPFHPQKCFTPTLGGNTKRVLVGIIALSFFKKSFSILSGCRRRYEAMQNKSIEKKERKERREKRTSVLERRKNKR